MLRFLQSLLIRCCFHASLARILLERFTQSTINASRFPTTSLIISHRFLRGAGPQTPGVRGKPPGTRNGISHHRELNSLISSIEHRQCRQADCLTMATTNSRPFKRFTDMHEYKAVLPYKSILFSESFTTDSRTSWIFGPRTLKS